MTPTDPALPNSHARPLVVVCGMDFSRTAMAALELAVASAHGGTVHVVSAYELPFPPPFPEARLMSAPDTEMEAATKKELDRLTDSYRARGVLIDGRVVNGSAVHAILETARDTSAELVVVGTHGRTGLARLALGSVAERVVRLSPVPVLTTPLVREGEPIAAKQLAVILVATDFSPDSDAAILAGLRLARGISAVHLVHVLETSVLGAGDDIGGAALHIRQLALEREAMRHHGAASRITFRVRSGAADHEILHEAREIGADLIVVGTAGKTGLEHMVFGSVAERVVRGSRVPVLVARRTSDARAKGR
jgi:nucleotide-binding universal stress UspA family protein